MSVRRLLPLLLLAAACGTQDARTLSPSPSPSSTAGALYGASGRVVSVPGKPVRFCAATPQPAVLISPPPPPAYCGFGVDVEGVDLDRLDNRREQAGAIEGWAALEGTFDGTVLRVTKQGPQDLSVTPTPPDTPPCSPPDGGWPEGGDLDTTALTDYQAKHPEVLMIALLRPSQTQVLAYVLTSGDVDAAERALRPTYGERLCVHRSRFTKAELDAAIADPALQGGEGTQVFTWGGGGLSRDGELQSTVGATWAEPALLAAQARHPKGLVALDLFLNPVASAP